MAWWPDEGTLRPPCWSGPPCSPPGPHQHTWLYVILYVFTQPLVMLYILPYTQPFKIVEVVWSAHVQLLEVRVTILFPSISVSAESDFDGNHIHRWAGVFFPSSPTWSTGSHWLAREMLLTPVDEHFVVWLQIKLYFCAWETFTSIVSNFFVSPYWICPMVCKAPRRGFTCLQHESEAQETGPDVQEGSTFGLPWVSFSQQVSLGESGVYDFHQTIPIVKRMFFSLSVLNAVVDL